MPVFATNPETGEQVVYDEESGQWLKANFAPTVSAKDRADTIAGTKEDMTTVTPQRNIATNPQTGEVKQWDGREWTTIQPPKTASATPAAKPGQPPMAEGFINTLMQQLSEGGRTLARGLMRPGQQPKDRPTASVLEPFIGAGQIVGAPGVAAGQAVGQNVQDATIGLLGPTGSALAATMVDIPTQILSGGLIGKAVQLGRRAGQAIAPHLPGASVALREEGKAVARAVPGSILPNRPSSELYDIVAQENPKIAVPNLKATYDDIAAQEKRLPAGLRSGRLVSTTAGLKGKAEQKGETVLSSLVDEFGRPIVKEIIEPGLKDLDFQDLRLIERRLGARIGELRRKGGEELGATKRLYKSIRDDLEAAESEGSGEAYAALKAANKSARREFASAELNEIVEKNILKREGQELETVNFSRMLNEIKTKARKDDLFRGSFEPGELNKIQTTLNELSKLPVGPPPKGVNVGSALVLQRTGVGGGLGAAMGGAVAGPTGAAIGGGLGTAIGAGAPWLISRALTSENGRKLLINYLRQPGGITPEKMAGLLTALHAAGELQELGQQP